MAPQTVTRTTYPGPGETFQPGDVLWFEYHCEESFDSDDAPIWLRSHQLVTVLGLDPAHDDARDELPTFDQRAAAGHPLVYRARFADGLEWSLCEDEPMCSPDEFCRPDPTRTTDHATA